MKKKLCFLIICLLGLVGCAEQPTLEGYINEAVEADPMEEELIDVLTEINIENVYFGVSYINTVNTGKTIYLSGLIIDEAGAIVTETRGHHTAIYLYPDTDEFTWYWKGNNTGELDPYKYMELKSDNKTYYSGLLEGSVKNIQYTDAIVKSEILSVNTDKDIDVTLWVVELSNDEKFTLDKLTY